MRSYWLICAWFLVLLTACGDQVCAGVGRPAIVVVVLDSLSGAHVGKDADLLIYALNKNGARIDSVRGTDTTGVLGGWDEHGPMRVVVRRAGYVPWTRDSVLVRAEGGNCTTIPEHLIARLQPAG